MTCTQPVVWLRHGLLQCHGGSHQELQWTYRGCPDSTDVLEDQVCTSIRLHNFKMKVVKTFGSKCSDVLNTLKYDHEKKL